MANRKRITIGESISDDARLPFATTTPGRSNCTKLEFSSDAITKSDLGQAFINSCHFVVEVVTNSRHNRRYEYPSTHFIKAGVSFLHIIATSSAISRQVADYRAEITFSLVCHPLGSDPQMFPDIVTLWHEEIGYVR